MELYQPDAQPAIAMEGGAAARNHREEGQGGTHTTGNHRGGGGIPWGGGGRGGLAALHHIYIYRTIVLRVDIYEKTVRGKGFGVEYASIVITQPHP